MGRRPQREQGDTLAEIRAAAFGLFGRYGYDGVSIADVASAAGVTKPALYWHFPNKDALYIDALLQLQSLFRAHVFEPMAREPDPLERMVTFFTGAASLVADPRIAGGVAGYWLDPSTARLPQAREVLVGFEREAEGFVAATLHDAVGRGQVRSEIDVSVIAQTAISVLQAIVLPMLMRGEAHTRGTIAALAYTFFRAYAVDPAVAQRAMALKGGPSPAR